MEESSSPPPALVPPSTLRRNPPRRARHTPFVPSSLTRFNAGTTVADIAATINPFSLDDEPENLPPPPPPIPSIPSSKSSDSNSIPANLNVFLRIRPLEIKSQPRSRAAAKNLKSKTRAKGSPQNAKKKQDEACLVVSGPGSVTLTIPKSKLIDSKRGTKNEVYDGFAYVFPPESQQIQVFEKVMSPLVTDFFAGKSALLIATGPTGSGKTHTMYGSARDPGLVPLTLKKIFCSNGEENPKQQRSFCLAMVEIYSTNGKGEKMIDLLSSGTELSLVQSTIKGLEEIPISSIKEAERLVAIGLSKRSTAATDANSQSSRSQCIITIRSQDITYNGNGASIGNGVLMIADLAGAERERKTGNAGSRLGESNFINNTSMVFGNCLRSLLDHQKNPKKKLEKHYKNSLLTRYLKDYLEGKKKMTLILTVKPGEEDYTDTSFVLRQASPYMKIKYTDVEEVNAPPVQKRSNKYVSLVHQENNKKRRKVEVPVSADSIKTDEKISEKVDSEKIEMIEKTLVSSDSFNDLSIELEKTRRNEEMMTNFAKAFWKCLKQYKTKLSKSEEESKSLREIIIEKNSEIIELKEELNKLRSVLSCQQKTEITEDSSDCSNKKDKATRDDDDLASIVIEESDLSSKDSIGTEDQHLEEVNESEGEEFSFPLFDGSSNKEKGNGLSEEALEEIEDQASDVKQEKSVNLEELNLEMKSVLDELNQDMSSHLEELKHDGSVCTDESEEEVIAESEDFEDQEVHVTCEGIGDLKLEKGDGLEELNQETKSSLAELNLESGSKLGLLNQEISSDLEELKKETSMETEEIKEEISSDLEELKKEISMETEEIKEEKQSSIQCFEETHSSLEELNQETDSNHEEFNQETSSDLGDVEEGIIAEVKEIEVDTVIMSQQLDVTFESVEDFKEEKSDNQEMKSSLNELNQEMSSEFEELTQETCYNLDELKEENGVSSEGLKKEISAQTECFKEIKSSIEQQNRETYSILEELNLETNSNLEEPKDENVAILEELREEICGELIVMDSPDQKHSDEKSSIERYKIRQPIKNSIEATRQENLESSNPLFDELNQETNSEFDELDQETGSSLEELKEETIAETEEIIEEKQSIECDKEMKSGVAELNQETNSSYDKLNPEKSPTFEELKKELSTETPETKEELIVNDTPDRETSSIEQRRKNRPPIENLIETIGKENRASPNRGKAKKPKRKLLPASSMLLKEFTSPDCEMDVPKEGRGKIPSGGGTARTEGSMSLIELLSSKPRPIKDKLDRYGSKI